jgi:hypothetical protein
MVYNGVMLLRLAVSQASPSSACHFLATSPPSLSSWLIEV